MPINSESSKDKAAWFWAAMRHYAPIYRHAFMASVVINLVAIASPLFTMNVYDRVIPNNATETLWVLASGIAIIYGFDFLIRSLRSYFVDVAGRNADVVISSMLMHKMLTMKLAARPVSTGALVSNMSQFEALRDFFSSTTLLACIDVPFLCIFLILLFFIGGPLVTLPLLAIPILFIAGYLFQWAARRSAEQQHHQSMHKNALLMEIIHGLETVKTSMAEDRMQRHWEDVVELSAASNIHSRAYTSRALALSTLVTQSVTVTMIVWGVYRIQDGVLTMGGLIACNILAGRAMAPLMQMAGLLTRFQNARLSLSALNTLMDLPQEVAGNEQEDEQKNGPIYKDNNQQNASLASLGNLETLGTDLRLEKELRLDDVSFAYPDAKRLALQNVNVRIKAGERVGIIGGMGSGKSTLVKMLMGLYEPRDGGVFFGGVDIRQLSTSALRRHMAFVPQDAMLFSGSIRDNIAMSDSKVTDDAILKAAELAGVADFVRHNPAGFGAQVGEQGRNLSGGQRQAIAIARALVRNADILILDEATSNMDTRSEKGLQERLAMLSTGDTSTKTLILVTHRMSMLRLVDRLIVMDAGRIVMDGKKADVLGKVENRRARQG